MLSVTSQLALSDPHHHVSQIVYVEQHGLLASDEEGMA